MPVTGCANIDRIKGPVKRGGAEISKRTLSGESDPAVGVGLCGEQIDRSLICRAVDLSGC
jgi:hypothetical protein